MAFGISYEEFRGFYLGTAAAAVWKGWSIALEVGGTRFPNSCSPYTLGRIFKKNFISFYPTCYTSIMAKMEIKKILPTLKNRQWYNQRFDGSPLFLYFMGSADVLEDRRKPKGTNGKIGICFFEDGKADWFFDMQDIQDASKKLVAAAKKNPQLSTSLLKKWKSDEKRFEHFFLKIFPTLNLRRLSNEGLFVLLKKIFTFFTRATSSTSIIDRFALGTDELIGNMIRKEAFSGKTPYKESEFVSLFSSLTAPVHQSFINQAEIDLLKIAAKASTQTLEDYQKKYFWIHNNYVTAEQLTVDFFKKQIATWKKSKKDLLQEARQIAETPARNKRIKQGLLKRHSLSTLLKTLITISEDFTWWQDQRKKFTYFNIHMGAEILKEISRRTNYTLEQLKYTTLGEIQTLLTIKKPTKATLALRIKNSAFILTPTGSLICEGNDASRLKKTLFAKTHNQDVQDFRGLSACTGRAIGRVRLIQSAKEMYKMKQGEILIAVMTRPDYVPAMKKAAAIVTDEGGVTSHAAIISRELNIPCIIGTKIATKILKTGDLVQVNANHGWIKKIA